MTTSIHPTLDVNNVLAAIDNIYDLLQAEAEDSERLRRPTPAVQQALKESGVFQLLLPVEYGGAEAGPLEIIEVISRLSRADGSLAWLARVLTSETGYAAASLPEETARELFGGEDKALVAGLASMDFSGTARRVDGGYIVDGEWQYVPGLSMATHVDLGVTVEETGERIICVVPRSSLRVTDNWKMLGLLSSGTLDYSAWELFVPDNYTFLPGPENLRRGADILRLSPSALATLNQGAWSQGVGERILDELKQLTQENRGHSERDVTSAEFYAEFARHYSHVRGTGALLREIWGEVNDNLERGTKPDVELQTMMRLAAALSTRTVLEISHLAHRFAGASVMRNGVLQRFFRDGHAGTQHRGTAHLVTQQCGEILSGTLPEGTYWGFYDLVVPEPE
ncbi:acyl-CoA dehydrogenase family protein [Corynebacterium comes]|uniref:Flavin-dependent monooxygenase, oxygenase subunit HsaA n=1 Tax=Corynebacterium comes TaxID=2675218 RepID=A0A6B8VJY0_9CORY|nr:acyl-CoA dehydrogenase family protein [Corynebacterium comes]QGU03369.1 Flavin-dependent monooxygenase, oxygenase subunit HsaA [Corynebacterium comes]